MALVFLLGTLAVRTTANPVPTTHLTSSERLAPIGDVKPYYVNARTDGDPGWVNARTDGDPNYVNARTDDDDPNYVNARTDGDPGWVNARTDGEPDYVNARGLSTKSTEAA